VASGCDRAYDQEGILTKIYVTNYSPEYLAFLRNWRKCLKRSKDSVLPAMRNPFIRKVVSPVEPSVPIRAANPGEAKP